jgi:hypothetical protein
MKHIKEPKNNKEHKVKLQYVLGCSVCPPNKGCNTKYNNNKARRSKPKRKDHR